MDFQITYTKGKETTRTCKITFKTIIGNIIKSEMLMKKKCAVVFLNKKMLLKLALLSLTESMRKDPDKFNACIFYDNKSSSSTTQTRGYSQYYDTVPFGQQQQQYQSQDCMDMLLEEAEKLCQ